MEVIWGIIKFIFWTGVAIGACYLGYLFISNMIKKFEALKKRVLELEGINVTLSQKVDYFYNEKQKLEKELSNIRTQLEKRDQNIVQNVFKELGVEKPSQQSKLLD